MMGSLFDAALFLLVMFVLVPIVVLAVHFHTSKWYFGDRDSLSTDVSAQKAGHWWHTGRHVLPNSDLESRGEKPFTFTHSVDAEAHGNDDCDEYSRDNDFTHRVMQAKAGRDTVHLEDESL